MIDKIAVSDAINADICRFSDMMIADGTVLRLQESLSDQFEASHEEQAGEKLNLLHNTIEQTVERIDITDGKAHDSMLFKTGLWLENRLLLFITHTSIITGLSGSTRTAVTS